MKKVLNLIIAALITLTITSCATIYAQDTVYSKGEPTVNVVIEYGTPYYTTNSLIAYYIYKGWYCYPYYYNNMYGFHYYRKPLPYRDIRHYRPMPRGYKHVPNYRAWHHRPNINHRMRHGTVFNARPNIPTIQKGNSTHRNHENNSGGRHFGSRR